jgi:hypothetical protein
MTVKRATRNLATLAVLSFALRYSLHGQTTTTNTDCNLNGNTANCTSTSTSDAAQIAQQQAQQAERDKQLSEAGQNLGNALGTAINNARIRKGIRKYCDAHPGENFAWQVNGKVVTSGVCPGELPLALARQQFIDGQRQAFIKNGVAGYAEFSGDTLIIHSERASAMRFHANIADVRMLAAIRAVHAKTFVYTNDQGQRFEYDAVAGHDVTSAVATPAVTPAAATVSASSEQALSPCPAGTVRMPTADGGGCK